MLLATKILRSFPPSSQPDNFPPASRASPSDVKRPNTADPLPDSPAATAPADTSSRRIAAISGCEGPPAASQSFRTTAATSENDRNDGTGDRKSTRLNSSHSY